MNEYILSSPGLHMEMSIQSESPKVATKASILSKEFLLSFIKWGYLVNYLVGDVVGEPIKAFIKTFPRCGTSALNVPVKEKKKTFYYSEIKLTTCRPKYEKEYELYQWRWRRE